MNLHVLACLNSGTAVQRCSIKISVQKILENSYENTSVGIVFELLWNMASSLIDIVVLEDYISGIEQ